MAMAEQNIDNLPDNTPVIIAVGQFSERPDDADYRALSPMDIAGEALQAAIADAQPDSDAVQNIAAHIDTIAAIRQFEISTPVAEAPFGRANNVPRAIASRVGAAPKRAILEITGGQAPQKLVGELAADIAQGKSDMAAIVSSEAISTMLSLLKSGKSGDWAEEHDGDMDDRGYGIDGMIDGELIRHGAKGVIPVYAIYDNARRAKLGLSLAAYRQKMGELFAPFTAIAAQNPHSAAPIRHSAADLAEITTRNRIISEPYPRMTIARDQVNQGAAIIIASLKKARELGIASEQFIFVHGVADSAELSPLSRPDLTTSSASNATISAALAQAGKTMEDMDFIDLYSCFAIAVFSVMDEFGLSADDPRGLTLTGGLPYFGGAGNGYSTHAIAEAVAKCRANPGKYALVGANGGVMSKYATGIYSTAPAAWKEQSWQHLSPQAAPVSIAETAPFATVESYTFMEKKGAPLGILVGRTDDGARIVAMADSEDEQTVAAVQKGEIFGQKMTISQNERGKNIARLLGE